MCNLWTSVAVKLSCQMSNVDNAYDNFLVVK